MSRADIFEKLQIAASMEAKNIIPSLSQLIGYRQKIVQDILRSDDIDQSNNLIAIYLEVNERIKQLIAI